MTLLDSLNERIRCQFNLDDLLGAFTINVDSHVSKKNGRPIRRAGRYGKPFIGKSCVLVHAESVMLHEIVQQARKARMPMIEEPTWAVFHFYFPRDEFYTKRGTVSETLPDLSNLYELPQDVLQKAKVIRNDTLIHSHDLSRRLPGDSYRLDIFLLKYNLERAPCSLTMKTSNDS